MFTLRLVAASTLHLEALLAPLSLQSFQQRYFEREPLHVERPSCPKYYGPLADLSTPERPG